MEEFLKRLQNSDQRTKMRVAVAVTSVLMVAVIVVWLSYFNTLVGVDSVAQTSDIESDEFSFWGSVKSGTAMMFNNVKGIFGSKDIDIKPSN